ncbi:hypothetical protein BD769DRAFT_1391566 [Suillus cothurnatus]|nr:hypothetical protein BD769DRAFT_1391566 [Suillus cothurnatus]
MSNSPRKRSGSPKGGPKVMARVFVEADIKHQGMFGTEEKNENLYKKKDNVPSGVCNVYTLQFCSGIRESAKSENNRTGRRYIAVVGESIAEPKRWNVWGKTRAPDGKQVNYWDHEIEKRGTELEQVEVSQDVESAVQEDAATSNVAGAGRHKIYPESGVGKGTSAKIAGSGWKSIAKDFVEVLAVGYPQRSQIEGPSQKLRK